MPKLEIEIVFEGNIRVPVKANVESLADLAKLGGKMTAAARGVAKLMPDLKNTPIKSLDVRKEK